MHIYALTDNGIVVAGDALTIYTYLMNSSDGSNWNIPSDTTFKVAVSGQDKQPAVVTTAVTTLDNHTLQIEFTGDQTALFKVGQVALVVVATSGVKTQTFEVRAPFQVRARGLVVA